MVRHTCTHFICIISTHGNKWIFINDVKPFNVVIESLDDIYSQNPTEKQLQLILYTKAADFIYLGLNGNFRILEIVIRCIMKK